LGVLVIACIATFAVIRFEEHKEKIKNSDEIILAIPGDSVQSLSWENETEILSFHRDEQWFYDEDEAFPVDEEKIDELLKVFEEFGASFIIEEVEDYGQYGLNDPICTINLSTEEQSYEILLGNYSNMDAQRYVSIGDGNVYLVKNDPMDHFDAGLSDMIAHDETPRFDNVTEIRFAGAESYKVIYEEDSGNTYRTDDVYFAQLSGRSLPLDTSRVDSYLRNVSRLNLTNYVTYKVTDEELQKYGLDEPELTVTVNYTTENEEGEEVPDTFVLHVSRDPEERKAVEEAAKEEKAEGEAAKSENKTAEDAAKEGEKAAKEASKEDNDSPKEAEEEEITAYARVGQSQIVYKIASDDYKDLMAASYDSLRHLEVLPADFADIRQIDISLEGNDYTVTSEKKGDERTYYYQEEELEIADLQNALEGLAADSFTVERPRQNKEIGLTVHLDMENDPKIKIDLYRYDGTYCLAVVDGKPVSLVKRSNVVDLIEAVHAIVL